MGFAPERSYIQSIQVSAPTSTLCLPTTKLRASSQHLKAELFQLFRYPSILTRYFWNPTVRFDQPCYAAKEKIQRFRRLIAERIPS